MEKIRRKYSADSVTIEFPGVGYVEGITPGTIEVHENGTVNLKGFAIEGATTFQSYNEDFEYKTGERFSINLDAIQWIMDSEPVKNWLMKKPSLRLRDGTYLELHLRGLESI